MVTVICTGLLKIIRIPISGSRICPEGILLGVAIKPKTMLD